MGCHWPGWPPRPGHRQPAGRDRVLPAWSQTTILRLGQECVRFNWVWLQLSWIFRPSVYGTGWHRDCYCVFIDSLKLQKRLAVIPVSIFKTLHLVRYQKMRPLTSGNSAEGPRGRLLWEDEEGRQAWCFSSGRNRHQDSWWTEPWAGPVVTGQRQESPLLWAIPWHLLSCQATGGKAVTRQDNGWPAFSPSCVQSQVGCWGSLGPRPSCRQYGARIISHLF